MRTQAEQLLGARVSASDGKVIGTVEQVFRDDVDGTPAWARIRSGKTGQFVPLGTSQVTGEGLRVPFDSPTVMNSPSIEAGQHMSAAQCEQLSRYYGLFIPAQQAPREQAPGQQAPSQQVPGQQAPSQQIPSQQIPGQQIQGEQIQGQQVPSQEVPSQQAAGIPADQEAAQGRTPDRDSGEDVIARTQAEQLLGARVTGSDGKVMGTVEQVFRDDVDGTPAWAWVRSGRTGRFVPLGTSQVTAEGLHVPFDSPRVMSGPNIEAGHHMSAAQCEELSRYYGLTIPAQQAPGQQAPSQQVPTQQAPSQQAPFQQAPSQQVPTQQAPSQQAADIPTDQDAAQARTADKESADDITMRTQPEHLLGARVTGSDGNVIGTVEQVFRDDVDGTPAWARIRSGKVGQFVPLGTSQVTAEGLRVSFDSPTVMNSPSIEAGQHMSAAQAEQLSQYYGLSIPPQQAPG